MHAGSPFAKKHVERRFCYVTLAQVPDQHHQRPPRRELGPVLTLWRWHVQVRSPVRAKLYLLLGLWHLRVCGILLTIGVLSGRSRLTAISTGGALLHTPACEGLRTKPTQNLYFVVSCPNNTPFNKISSIQVLRQNPKTVMFRFLVEIKYR